MFRFPSQLSIRLGVLLCILLAGSTMGFNWLYRNHLRSAMAPKMGEGIAAQIRTLKLDLHHLQGTDREEWLKAFNTDPGVTLEQLPPDHPPPRPPLQNGYMYVLQESIRQYAGQDTQVSARLTPPNNALFVDFPVDGQSYRLTIPAGGFTFADVWPFAWLIASNFLIVWIGAAFAVWQIKRPLQSSAAALNASANQLTEIKMPASAPAEFHVFANRFNQLAAKMKAQERERALLLAGVSHDLRAPLNRIRLRAELMDDDTSGMGNGMILDSESMRHIIDQFLHYQRGIVKAHIEPTDLRGLADRTAQRYRELGNAVEVTGEACVIAPVDSAAIERILNNLIDNALSYGKPPIEIQIAHEGEAAILQVRDHGPGIAEGDLQRLLQPFERLDQSRSLQGHCGLGLAIIDRITRELGGELSLFNHSGGGLVAHIRLPLSQAQPSSPSSSPSAATA